MKKLKANALILLLILSCGTLKNNDEILGHYKSKDNHFEIILEKESFSYIQKGSLYTAKSEGIWLLEENNIILKSKNSYKDNMIEVEEIDYPKAYIEVLDSSNRPISDVANIILTYKNDEVSGVFTTDSIGRIIIPSGKEIKSIKVGFIDTFDYKVKNSKKSYIIKVFPDNLDKRYFESESLKIKSRYILLNGYKLLKIKTVQIIPSGTNVLKRR